MIGLEVSAVGANFGMDSVVVLHQIRSSRIFEGHMSGLVVAMRLLADIACL